MEWQEHVTVDPTICHGKACIRGTRVLVSAILDNIAAGETKEAILESDPTITVERSMPQSPTQQISRVSA